MQGRLCAIDESVQYKESLCEVNEHAKNYKMCNELTDEIFALKCEEKNTVNCELSILMKNLNGTTGGSQVPHWDLILLGHPSSCSSSSADAHMPLAKSSVTNQPNPFCLGLPPV